jgi:hypothetical protein
MAGEFKEMGFHFHFPENWTVTRDRASGYPRSVMVQSPSGAFWSVTADRPPASELVERVVQAISAEYEEAELETIDRQVGPTQLTGIELNFYCLDLLVVAQVLAVEQEGRALAILLQAESREFDELARVFDAITWSLIRAGKMAE